MIIFSHSGCKIYSIYNVKGILILVLSKAATMYHVTCSEQVASSLPMTTSIKKACVCVLVAHSQSFLGHWLE